MQILDWIFRGYWFSVTILSSVLLHSTMLRAYWMLEIIYGTVRPAQLECFILGTRVETKLVKCRLEHSLKCHGLHFRSRASMVLNWGGGANTPPPCPYAFWSLSDWVARLFKTISSLFSLNFLTTRSKWVKLKNWKINPNDKPSSLKRRYQPFNFPFDYRYLSTLKTVLKICAQANVLGLLWYDLIKDDSV